MIHGLDWQTEVEGQSTEEYIMSTLKLNMSMYRACLHSVIADQVLEQALDTAGGLLNFLRLDELHIESIVYQWLSLKLMTFTQTAPDNEKQVYSEITETTKRHIMPFLLIGAVRANESGSKSAVRMQSCLTFLDEHKERFFAIDNYRTSLPPKEWLDTAAVALAYETSNYAVNLCSVTAQAAAVLRQQAHVERPASVTTTQTGPTAANENGGADDWVLVSAQSFWCESEHDRTSS